MDWGAIAITALGSGALVAAINALANRKKTAAEAAKIKADIIDTLAEYYAAELTALREKVNGLECKIDALKVELDNREVTIDKLKQENAELTLQVAGLKKQLARKDARVLELEKQVAIIPELEAKIADLTDRLNALGNDDCEGWFGGTD